MAYIPISGTMTQYMKNATETTSGYWLKGYRASSSTSLQMATDNTGSTLLTKCTFNSDGYPISNEGDQNSHFIPHFNLSYKLSLYATEADADENINAIWTVDGIDNGQGLTQTVDRLQERVIGVCQTVANMTDADGPIVCVGNALTSSQIANMADTGALLKTSEYNSGTGVGGAEYVIKTRAQHRTDIGDAGWVPDGYGDHYLLGGTTYVSVLAEEYRSKVKAYGAIPIDSSTYAAQNTLAIQAAINNAKSIVKTDIANKVVFVAGEVDFEDGIYHHNELTSNAGIKLRGNDMSTCQLVFSNPTSSTGAITFDDVSDELFAVYLEGISMDGGGSTGWGLACLEGIRICGVDRCYIHSFDKNISATNCFTFEINRSYLRTATTYNLELDTCTGGTCRSTRIDNSSSDNVWISGGSFSFENCQIQSAVGHGIHGVDAENVSVFNCFFEANDKNITGSYNDIFLEDGVLNSTRYLNVTGGFFTTGPGVGAGLKLGPVNVERANLVTVDTDARGNGYTTGVTLGADVQRAIIAGNFVAVGSMYSAPSNVRVTDQTERVDNAVTRIKSDGVDSTSYNQNDWQLQVGTDGDAFVGIGTHDSGRPALQGFGTGSSSKLLLNPEAGNVGIGAGAVNPDEKLVVDGIIKTLGAWNVNGHQIGGIVLFANGNDLRLSIGVPTSATDGILIGTAT